MDAIHKRILRSLSLALRHELEGWRDENRVWHTGDLERRLAELGIHREKSKPLDEMPHLSGNDRRARVVVDGYIQLRADAGVERDEAVVEFVRESAYTWANRLFALRCMEARGLIDEVILQKPSYAGRSLVHHRFLRKDPEAAAGEDDGLFAVLFAGFVTRAAELPSLFDPRATAVALRPSVAALKRCVALLSGSETVRGQEPATDAVFSAPDALGWAYQYWNTEEKARVFEAVRTKKGTKIEGADIIPATQLYTEPYMVKFLVQNSLGALWMSLHPDSRLCDGWEYYVRDADRTPPETLSESRSVRDFTFLDPALGSGHFHLEAFDVLFAMYHEENATLTPREIAASILNRNLFGIDLDERAVQIAEAALWMKAKDAAPELETADLDSFHDHLVATNIRLPQGGDHLGAFLRQHSEDAPLRPALEVVFRGLEHADELGSLLQIEEPVHRELRRLKADADAARTTSVVQPDMFRANAVQLALPVDVESYEEWKVGALDRLKAHFEQEAEAADSVRAFFGVSARKGIALFDLLARRYDVVAANPPYMGSKNMGAVLKSFVERSYPAGKRDVYAAFILRCRELAAAGGRVAMVTQQSWMFLRSFVELRSGTDVKDSGMNGAIGDGMLRLMAIEVLAHLGRYAFSEIGNAVVQPVPFVALKTAPLRHHRIWACRLNTPRVAEAQATLLRECAEHRERKGRGHPLVHRPEQFRLLNIPQAPLCYWLPERFFELLAGSRLRDFAAVRQGMATGDNERFTRCFWEVTDFGTVKDEKPTRGRWYPYAKGGRFQKWAGLEWLVVDWQANAAVLRQSPQAVFRSPQFYFRRGLTYTPISQGALGARMLTGSVFDVKGASIFLHSDSVSLNALSAALNTYVSSYLSRVVSQGFELHVGYLANLPLRISRPALLSRVGEAAQQLKQREVSVALTERTFDFRVQEGAEPTSPDSAVLHAIEGFNESIICDSLGLLESDRAVIQADVGTPVGCFPLLAGLDTLPPRSPGLCDLPVEFDDFLAQHERRDRPEHELGALRQRLRQHYEAGPGDSRETDDTEQAGGDESDDGDALTVCAHLPIPTETFLEELSQKLELHPISIYWLLKDGVEQKGWRCPPEEKRLTADRFTVLVLRMLGHRWPKQIEAGEPMPDWADRDDVIPISAGFSEPTLAARVLERLSADFPDRDPAAFRAEFEEIVGTPLETWLAGSFFERHISQFRKRPIAWQIRSEPSKRRSEPARGPTFSGIFYYHRLDADLLPKVRSHYLAALRTAHETEMRTLEALATRTPDQAARKAELEVLVDELNHFDAKLQAVVETGFGPPLLQPRLRQLAVDDAMLAMKARWLARLCVTLQAELLGDWLTVATAFDHHVDFPRWIAAAIAHLPHHCAKAGAKSPDAAKLPEDPTATTLAAVICAETDAMTATALERACAEWDHDWRTHVIDPLRTRISGANSALEALAAELEMLDGKNFTRAAEIAREQKRLRAEVKTLKAEVKMKTEQAGQLAGRIRKCTSPELDTWESWLASGPLFDEISSLDGDRAAPVTIRDFIQQESLYAPDLNDGVRVNIAPLQRAGILAADVLAAKDLDKAIADRAEWRADERRWVREGKLPQPGWWATDETESKP